MKNRSVPRLHILASAHNSAPDAKSNLKLSGTSSAAIHPIPETNPLNPFRLVQHVSLPIRNAISAFEKPTPNVVALSPKPALRLHLLTNTATQHLSETKSAKLPCFRVPQSSNPNFTGRDDYYRTIDEHLLGVGNADRVGNQNTRYFAACGMGGIGKTDLAVEYAHSRRQKFQAVFWLEAGGVSQLATDFGRIATHLGLESPDDAQDLGFSMSIAKAWLARPHLADDRKNPSWLLIFDNADNLDIIADYVTFDGNGSVLITSRDPFAKEHFIPNAGIDLQPLSTIDSATLLRTLIRRNGDGNADEKAASVEVATHFDGLPLALTQMAAFIRRRQLSIREFVNSFATDVRYLETRDERDPTQHRRYGATLATTFNFQDMSTDAMALLQLLAFLNPDRIREDIIVSTGAIRSDSIDSWAPPKFEAARYALLSSSIITRDIGKHELSIHRVVQTEVRASMNETARHKTFKSILSLLAHIWPPGNLISQASRRWALCEDLLPHLERTHQFFTEYADAWKSFEWDAQFPTLLNEAAVYVRTKISIVS
jgi:hypothetical protein